jgi:hypothetical protein
LADWLANCATFLDFPNALQTQRAGGEEFAKHGALLWDDPDFAPLPRMVAPKKG